MKQASPALPDQPAIAPDALAASSLLTPLQMHAVDRAAVAAGVPGVVLMEAAGRAVADAVSARWTARPVLVACGPGNNGGDGFVVARLLLARGWPVRLAMLGDVASLPADAAHHASLWLGAVEPLVPGALQGAEIVIDALFGAGLRRPLDGAAAAFADALCLAGLPVCAVDVPSGLDGSTGLCSGPVIPAHLTVTFCRKKPAHVLLPGRELCGTLQVADIGIPEAVLVDTPCAAWENTPAIWREQYPWPRIDGHKYHRGHALVVGGHRLAGATRLAAMAAARAGAGLTTIAAPAHTAALAAQAFSSLLFAPCHRQDDLAAILADVRVNAVVLGPGAGVSQALRDQVLLALRLGRAVVLDADAISAFADNPRQLFDAITGPCVLTPHDGEFQRLFPQLTDQALDKLARARHAAALSGAVVLLKGADTVIAAPDGQAIVNTNAPAWLATGGAGDVLAGMIAGLLAQGMAPLPAAAAAAWLHGQAAHRFGPGLVADDLLSMLPRVLRQCWRQWHD